MNETDLVSLLPEELEALFAQLSLPAWRSRQVWEWLSRGCRSYDEMTNLPRALRDRLSQEFPLRRLELLRHQVSRLDGTEKFLWGLQDRHSIETVYMRYHYGNSICLSSQVGCRQGCRFCASTLGGLVRNLTAGEMLDEVLFSEQAAGERASNLVLMGIGEPMDNLDEVIRFLQLVSHPAGRNLGLRHITISTCGVPEGIRRLADRKLPVTLSLSLHAPEDELRSRLMPSNRGIQRVLEACRYYTAETGRRLSFEYAMIRDTNDTPQQARLLADLARSAHAHVNLIPLNYVAERGMLPSTPETIKAFQAVLEKAGVPVTVRRHLGGDIDASCGQLRRKYEMN